VGARAPRHPGARRRRQRLPLAVPAAYGQPETGRALLRRGQTPRPAGAWPGAAAHRPLDARVRGLVRAWGSTGNGRTGRRAAGSCVHGSHTGGKPARAGAR
jgi:hypothetical protein